MSVILGLPAFIGNVVLGGFTAAIPLVAMVTVGAWWTLRRAHARAPDPSSAP